MVMTFILHPLSYYNSITEPCARFLLSLLKDISIDFPSHFILSLIDVYKDTTTRDKLIFPSAITRILCHFSISYPKSIHFFVMVAIDIATIRRSKAQLQPKRPRTETTTPLVSFAPSTSALSSSIGGVESSNTCINTLERLDPQIQNNQFKLYDKQLVCGK